MKASIPGKQAVCIGVSGEVKITWSFLSENGRVHGARNEGGKVLYVAFVKAVLRQKRLVFTEVPNFSIVLGLIGKLLDR